MPKARWTMIFLCLVANAINYIDRANLAVAAPAIEADLGIDAATMGLLRSGFFWTYAVMQMPFGYFADKVGARIALLAAVVWWSIFTALTAAARGVATFLGCRLLLGVGEAGAAPNAYVALVFFAIAYASLSFTAAAIWSLPGAVAPTPGHVASIGGIQNFASNLAGIVKTAYLFIVGNIEPLPGGDQGSLAPRATPAE